MSTDKLTPEVLDEVIETLGLLPFQARPVAERCLQKDRFRLLEIIRHSKLAELVLEENSEVFGYGDRSTNEELFENWFLVGWHARGVVEEVARLEEMANK
jgi:hypothetical protein